MQNHTKAVSILHHQPKSWASTDKPPTKTEEEKICFVLFFCMCVCGGGWGGESKTHYGILAGLSASQVPGF